MKCGESKLTQLQRQWLCKDGSRALVTYYLISDSRGNNSISIYLIKYIIKLIGPISYISLNVVAGRFEMSYHSKYTFLKHYRYKELKMNGWMDEWMSEWMKQSSIEKTRQNACLFNAHNLRVMACRI